MCESAGGVLALPGWELYPHPEVVICFKTKRHGGRPVGEVTVLVHNICVHNQVGPTDPTAGSGCVELGVWSILMSCPKCWDAYVFWCHVQNFISISKLTIILKTQSSMQFLSCWKNVDVLWISNTLLWVFFSVWIYLSLTICLLIVPLFSFYTCWILLIIFLFLFDTYLIFKIQYWLINKY